MPTHNLFIADKNGQLGDIWTDALMPPPELYLDDKNGQLGDIWTHALVPTHDLFLDDKGRWATSGVFQTTEMTATCI